jgi:V/A-type H+-transporting ATPase subunit F
VEVDKMKLKKGVPLIIEVPDRHGAAVDKDRITRYIKEAIGLKI